MHSNILSMQDRLCMLDPLHTRAHGALGNTELAVRGADHEL